MRWRRRAAHRPGLPRWTARPRRTRSGGRRTPRSRYRPARDSPRGRLEGGALDWHRAAGSSRPVSTRRTTRAWAAISVDLVGEGVDRQLDLCDHFPGAGVEHGRPQPPRDRDHVAVRAHCHGGSEGSFRNGVAERHLVHHLARLGIEERRGDADRLRAGSGAGLVPAAARPGRCDEQAAWLDQLGAVGDPSVAQGRVGLAQAAVGGHVPADDGAIPGHRDQPLPSGVDGCLDDVALVAGQQRPAATSCRSPGRCPR